PFNEFIIDAIPTVKDFKIFWSCAGAADIKTKGGQLSDMLHGHLDDKFACAGDAQCFACGMAAVGVGRANIIAWGQSAIVRECGCFARWDANVRAQVFLVERPKEQVTLAILLRPGGGCQFMYVGNGLCKWFFAGLEAVQF